MESFTYGNTGSDTVLIQPVDDHDLGEMETEIACIRKEKEDFCLIALKVKDWNNDLSPWEAPALYGNDAFGGKAEETLKDVLSFCQEENKNYYLGGYSLAGLFALWAGTKTGIFRGIAAASPSVWFPGFTDYLKEHPVQCPKVCLSLGDKEEKTRHPVMKTVGDRIRESQIILEGRGIECVLEWNPGNHFKDPGIRTARAYSRVLS